VLANFSPAAVTARYESEYHAVIANPAVRTRTGF